MAVDKTVGANVSTNPWDINFPAKLSWVKFKYVDINPVSQKAWEININPKKTSDIFKKKITSLLLNKTETKINPSITGNKNPVNHGMVYKAKEKNKHHKEAIKTYKKLFVRMYLKK